MIPSVTASEDGKAQNWNRGDPSCSFAKAVRNRIRG
jgi:hypothetical protein